MKRLLSGNQAIALAAYHAGVKVAAAYPGTPSTEILEAIATFKEVHAQWSPNEKVAMDVGIGASYGGVRALVSMKHVGLNVAADSFFAASVTGVKGGLVVISADDPGMHSSQNEQDNRHYARFAKVPMLEPTDSQDCYDLMRIAFEISEKYDTPVLFRSSTRISHATGVVEVPEDATHTPGKPGFARNLKKYVMIPANARPRHVAMERRLVELAGFVEEFPFNKTIIQDTSLGVITSGVGYQYAREVFPQASFLKLCMTYPFPIELIKSFAKKVEKVIVVEELDPFLEEAVRQLGIPVEGKKLFPIIGEFSTEVVGQAAGNAGLLENGYSEVEDLDPGFGIAPRPPVLCPGCPHTGTFYTLKKLGFKPRVTDAENQNGGKAAPVRKTRAIVAGDIGCYTLAVLPPLEAMDTCGCMGAGIGVAVGLEKAGVPEKVVAVIGDSTFIHSGIPPLIDSVYNNSTITTVILDNSVTAMTGHQEHPGTGITAQGKKTKAVSLEKIAQAVGVDDVKIVNAFDLKALEAALKDSVDRDEPSVIIARGPCALKVREMGQTMYVDIDRCNGCDICLSVGCPAIVKTADNKVAIEHALCLGDICRVCQQACGRKAIHVQEQVTAGGGR